MTRSFLKGLLALALLTAPAIAEPNIFDFGNENEAPKGSPPPAMPVTPDPAPTEKDPADPVSPPKPGTNPPRRPTTVRPPTTSNPPVVATPPRPRSMMFPTGPSGPVVAGPATRPAATDSAQVWAAYYIQRANANIGQVGSSYQQLSASSMLGRIQAAAGDAAGSRQTYAAQAKRLQPEMLTSRSNIVVETLAMSGDVDGALRASPEARPAGPNGQRPVTTSGSDIALDMEFERCIAWVARARADAGDYNGALDTLINMRFYGSVRTAVIDYILNACNEKSGLAGTRSLVVGIADKRIANECTRWLAIKYAKAGDFASAKALVKNVSTPMQRDSLRSSIMYHQAPKDLAAARAMLGEFEQDTYRSSAVGGMAIALQRAGDLQGALVTAKTIPSAEQRVSSLMQLAEAQMEAGDDSAAVIPTLQAADAMEKPRGMAMRARLLAAEGDITGACRLVAMIPHTEKKKEPAKASAYTAIALVQAKKGDYAGAQQTIDQMELLPSDTYQRDNATRQVMAVRVGAGDSAGAIRSIDLLPEPAKNSARSIILQEQLKVNDFVGARQMLVYLPSKVSYCRRMAVAQAQSPDPKIRADLLRWIDTLQTPEEVVSACAGAAEGLLNVKREAMNWPSMMMSMP